MKKQYSLEKIAKKIRFGNNDIIGVGVSGGVDSMVLLHAILRANEGKKTRIIVVHVNHCLRGEESDRDCKFVEDFCKRNNLEFVFESVDVKKNKKENKLTEEESARILRYQVFNRVIEDKNISAFYLAHHANDQAETVLMHIFRGSGMSGAIGMREIDRFVRPMIDVSRAQILEIAKTENIAFVEDSTNNKNICNRNILRNTILPTIEKIYPGVIDNIVKFSANLKNDQDFIDSCVPIQLLECKNNSVSLPVKALSMHSAIVYRLIMKAFNYLGVYTDVFSIHVEAIIKMQTINNGAIIDLPHEIIAAKEYDKITLYKKTTSNIDQVEQFIIGTTVIGNYEIKTEEVSLDNVHFGDGTLYICGDNLSDAKWRVMRPNDIFCKLGASGSKKLVDYYTDKKIPLLKRNAIPVLAIENEVLLILGYDISEKVKIDSKTLKIVRVTCLTKS